MARTVALVLAAGEGERIGLGPKAFLSVGGRCILDLAAQAAAACPMVESLVVALDEADGAVPVIPLAETVKRVKEKWVEETVARDDLRIAQTPQGFVAPVLREVHRRAAEARMRFTDDAAMLEWAGHRVRTVPGEPVNFKITTSEDLARAERFVVERVVSPRP